jgi:hypothetical protein
LGTVAVFGIGDLGGYLIRMLAQRPEVSKLYALDVDTARLETEAADAAAMASYFGRGPQVVPVAVDMRNEEAVAEVLNRLRPSVVVNTATLQSWWVITQLPADLWRRLEEEARFGPWLPMHLTLALKLMRALKTSGLSVPVVNVSFPDTVNPVLARLGMAPTCGAGNSDLLRAGVRVVAARRLKVPVEDVSVYMLAHHFHVVYYWMGLESVASLAEHPYWLRVMVGDRDVTHELGAEQLLAEAGRALPKGRGIMARTAASTAEKVLHLLGDTGALTHAPGPSGQIGGYDVRLSRDGASIVLPQGVKPEQATAWMEQAQRGDGVETILPDGSVVFTRQAIQAMQTLLGYHCPVLRPEECEDRADELRQRLRQLAAGRS